jgi:uncharacterized cofD-like protein
MKHLFKKYWRELIYDKEDKRRHTGKEIKIVAIGGGTGLSTLLRGIKQYSDDISAIVAMADSGGSTGKLREDFDIPPPGDIRKCIAALAYDEELISDIFNFRFKKDSNSLSGHTLGNIWLTGLAQHLGSFEKAVELTSQIFFTSGQIIPATTDKIELKAECQDGTVLEGEDKIPKSRKRIRKIYFDQKVTPYQKALEAIKKADLILIGPGSLYTSILPNLIIKKLSQTIRNNQKAVRIYISNVSTEKGETENFSIGDHIRTIEKHSGYQLFDYCLVNSNIIKTANNQNKLGSINNITTGKNTIEGCRIVKADIINKKNPLYHAPKKLAKNIIKIFNNQT